MLVDSDTQPKKTDANEPPELSPLWGLVLVLGEIAQRVERRQAEEHADDDDDDSEQR